MARTSEQLVEGKRVRVLTDGSGHPSQYIFCPACKTIHLFDDRWTFNNNFDKPTFSPSMLVHGTEDGFAPRCHTFVRNGKIEYLSDCSHEMKGHTIDLPEITDEMW